MASANSTLPRRIIKARRQAWAWPARKFCFAALANEESKRAD
jgi:hypothetical protein